MPFLATGRVIAILTLASPGILAQEVRLPIAGTMTYNALQISPQQGRTGLPLGWRFIGRVALPVTSRLYAGLAVGSWTREYHACATADGCPNALSDYAEAVNHSLYVQGYLSPMVFTRAGVGFARTETLRPDQSAIASVYHWRHSVTFGAGYDLRVRRGLYVTPSVDYAILPAVQSGASEIRWVVAYGIGLSVR
jgi:hypothetical protein